MTVHAAITALVDRQLEIAHASPHSANALGVTGILEDGGEAMAEEILRSGMSARFMVWDGLTLRIREIPRAELEAAPAPDPVGPLTLEPLA